MRMRRSIWAVGCLLVGVLAVLAPGAFGWINEEHYDNSRRTMIDGQSYCAYTGPGCSEFTGAGGTSCAKTDGMAGCGFNQFYQAQ